MLGLSAVILGLFAGLLHVWSGPDHLAAIAPLSAEWTQAAPRRRRSWVIGFRWGLGHSSGVMLIGLLSLVFREALPLNPLSSISERLVGVVLIVIGIWGLRRAFAHRVHSHPHKHGDGSHTHFHVHDTGTAHESRESAPHAHTHAAFAVGTLHGLAGSSHLFGVLPALAFPTIFGTIDYLFAYAAGTVLGMAVFSSAVAALRQWRFLSGAAGYRRIMCTCSGAAVVVGIYWIW
jgi:ABC-type nickel/cobalt efflux system permease component RcnA